MACSSLPQPLEVTTPSTEHVSAVEATVTSKHLPTATQVVINNDEGNVTASTNPLCKNDYFPVVKGAKWVYKITTPAPNSDPFSMYMLREIVQILSDGFSMIVDLSPTPEFIPKNHPSDSYIKWICLSDGLSLQLNSGVSVPKNLSAGYTWTQTSQLSPGVEIISTSLGVESITVPVGTFEAVKVKEEYVPGPAGYYVHWYVAGIGEVKLYYEDSTSSSVTELVSYSIPK